MQQQDNALSKGVFTARVFFYLSFSKRPTLTHHGPRDAASVGRGTAACVQAGPVRLAAVPGGLCLANPTQPGPPCNPGLTLLNPPCT